MTRCSTRMPKKRWSTWPRPSGRPPGGYHPALRAGAGPSPAKDNRIGRPGVLHLQRAGSGKKQEGRSEDAGRAENSGGILMRWPWRQRERSSPGRWQAGPWSCRRPRRSWRRCSTPGQARWRRAGQRGARKGGGRHSYTFDKFGFTIFRYRISGIT